MAAVPIIVNARLEIEAAELCSIELCARCKFELRQTDHRCPRISLEDIDSNRWRVASCAFSPQLATEQRNEFPETIAAQFISPGRWHIKIYNTPDVVITERMFMSAEFRYNLNRDLAPGNAIWICYSLTGVERYNAEREDQPDYVDNIAHVHINRKIFG
jgi:hypothetical protein